MSQAEKVKYVTKQMMYHGRGILGGTQVAIKLAPVAIKACYEWDLKEHVKNDDKFWTPENEVETQMAYIQAILAKGCEKIQEYCDEAHKGLPKTCECIVLQAKVMGMSK